MVVNHCGHAGNRTWVLGKSTLHALNYWAVPLAPGLSFLGDSPTHYLVLYIMCVIGSTQRLWDSTGQGQGCDCDAQSRPAWCTVLLTALCRQALNLMLGFGSLHFTQKEVVEHGDEGGSHCERHVAAVVSLGPWLVSSPSFYKVAHPIV